MQPDQPPAAVVQTFEQKYGLREKPPGVRFRVLDLPPLDTAQGSVAALRATAGSGSSPRFERYRLLLRRWPSRLAPLQKRTAETRSACILPSQTTYP